MRVEKLMHMNKRIENELKSKENKFFWGKKVNRSTREVCMKCKGVL